MNKEIIITGEWDGQPIWRQKTAGEKLVELLEQEKSNDTPRNNPTTPKLHA